MSDPAAAVRAATASALGRLGARSARDALIVALDDRVPDVRTAAAEALGHIGGRLTIDALLPIARDDRFEPARAAAEALARIDPVLVLPGRDGAGSRTAPARSSGQGVDVSAVSDVLVAFSIVSFVYFVVLNTLYLVLTALAWVGMSGDVRRRAYLGLDEMFRSPLTPGISVLVPAFNERAVIVESVRSLMGLRYPRHEVVVVNDGSTDDTLQELIRAFDLVVVRLARPRHDRDGGDRVNVRLSPPSEPAGRGQRERRPLRRPQRWG